MKFFEYDLQVRYRDLDTYNHVNNAVYFTYFESARVEALHQFFRDDPNFGIVIVHASATYLKPAFLRELLTIRLWVSKIGNTSFTLNYEVLKKKTSEVIATGKTIQVVINPKTGEKQAIAESFKDFLFEYYHPMNTEEE